MKKPTVSLTIVIVLTIALIIFNSSHQAQSAPAVKKLRVIDGGHGRFTSSYSEATEEESAACASAASEIQVSVTADKITGKISGTWRIVFLDGGTIAAGDITGGKMKQDSWRLSGTETSFNFGCASLPIPVTIIGQCGDDVRISFRAERQEQDSGHALTETQTATFNDASVSCSK